MEALPAALLSVWGTAADDVWAVGGDPGDGLGPYVLHFDGDAWTRLETGARGELWWVHGFAGGPVFMAGAGGTVLRWQDGKLERMPTPDDRGTVFGIWGSAPDALWAVGGVGEEGGFIWRYERGRWAPAEVAPELIAERPVFKVWGNEAGDLRFVGGGGLALRFDGERFTQLQTGTEELLFTVHSDGDSFVAVGGRQQGVILEERAGTWSDVAPEACPALNGVAERDGDAYAVGANGEVLEREHGPWARIETGLDLARDLHSVWIDPEGTAWSVGGHVIAPPFVDGVMIRGHGQAVRTRPERDALRGDECTRDGECDDEVFCNGVERCRDGSCELGPAPDCDDGVGCTSDTCDERVWACRHLAPDQDGDGHGDPACVGADGRPGGDDCDDGDPGRHPGAQEQCDPLGRDEDCDLATVGEVDEDGDGFAPSTCCNAAAHRQQCGADCDDSDSAINPRAVEQCDDRDNDCDGRSDEGALSIFYPDQDGDGYGVERGTVQGCAAERGYALQAGDCDDGDRARHPGAVDVCDLDEVDQDCSGTPNDPPGGCSCQAGSTQPCPLPGRCAAGMQPCEQGSWSVTCTIEPEAERCNDLDDDCDGLTDEGAAGDCYPDADGDGYAAPGTAAERMCFQTGPTACPSGWTDRAPQGIGADCAEGDRARSPAGSELCNALDDDCDDQVDEGLALVPRYVDADGDGYPGTLAQRCPDDTASAVESSDCMDSQALVHPDQQGSFSSPACPAGTQPCDAGGGSWRCRASAGESCDASLPVARWDYDCNGADEQTPPVTAPCGQGGDCSGGCGQSGFRFVAGATCGKAQPYQVCRCVGAQGGGCSEAIQMLPMTCR